MEKSLEKYKILITKVLTGEATTEEKKALQEWIDASDENRKLYSEFSSVWNIQPSNTGDISFDKQSAWENILAETEMHDSMQTGKIRTMSRTYIYPLTGIAAMFLILFGLYFLLPRQEFAATINYVYLNRGLEPVVLSDGTKVHFSDAGSISYMEGFKGNQRVVRFEGQAFFEIAVHDTKTFVVDMPYSRVEVLGTSFHLNYSEISKITELSVITGKVNFIPKSIPEQAMIISAGEKVIYHSYLQRLEKDSISDYNFLAWKTGRLEFNQTRLPEVLQTLEDTYQIKIIAYGDLSDLKLTARFIDEKPEDIFKTLELLFGLKTELVAGVYHIEK
jgi:transmembrane sensor